MTALGKKISLAKYLKALEPASPVKVKEEAGGAATPATASRRSSRLAGRSETPSEAMKKLNMSE